MDLHPHPSGRTHPYFIRLSVDVDPAGNPIARHATLFQDGQDKGTLWLHHPDPFDSVADAWADLTSEWVDTLGTQPTLF